jgi:hypothetical protein
MIGIGMSVAVIASLKRFLIEIIGIAGIGWREGRDDDDEGDDDDNN